VYSRAQNPAALCGHEGSTPSFGINLINDSAPIVKEALKVAASQTGTASVNPQEVKETVKEAVQERVEELVKESLEES
jgi:hypothetical protein